MSQTNLQIITASLRLLTIVDEITEPSEEQAQSALTILNDMMADFYADGIRLNWYPQTDLSATAPLEDSDIRNIKILLAEELGLHYGIEITPSMQGEAKEVYRELAKRYLRYVDADLTILPFSQGGLFGPGRI